MPIMIHPYGVVIIDFAKIKNAPLHLEFLPCTHCFHFSPISSSGSLKFFIQCWSATIINLKGAPELTCPVFNLMNPPNIIRLQTTSISCVIRIKILLHQGIDPCGCLWHELSNALSTIKSSHVTAIRFLSQLPHPKCPWSSPAKPQSKLLSDFRDKSLTPVYRKTITCGQTNYYPE